MCFARSSVLQASLLSCSLPMLSLLKWSTNRVERCLCDWPKAIAVFSFHQVNVWSCIKLQVSQGAMAQVWHIVGMVAFYFGIKEILWIHFLQTLSETVNDDTVFKNNTGRHCWPWEVFLILELTINCESITVKFALLCIKWITLLKRICIYKLGWYQNEQVMACSWLAEPEATTCKGFKSNI